MDNYHIVKSGDVWAFQKAGSSRAIRKLATKDEMIAFMRSYMSNKVGSVKIHKADGSFQEERTFPRKNDPVKTKG